MRTSLKQIHLAAHFPGVNNTTVWGDPHSGSQIEFSSFVRLAQTAERAKFDFLFLAEGLRLREQGGRIYDLDVVGWPNTFVVLAALAAVTDRLGLAGTISSTFNEPYEVARQFASLDHLSGGRAAWNVVTSWDAFTGENFRRGRARDDLVVLPAATFVLGDTDGEAQEQADVIRHQQVSGTPVTVAETIDEYVQGDASDGFILVPHITPGGLDEFADKVVPLLQDRGVFRSEYQGTTLRDHLGLALPRRNTGPAGPGGLQRSP